MGFAALARLRAPAAAALPRNAVLKPAAKRQAAGARSLARSLIHSLLPISTALTRFPPCSVPPPPPFQLNISNPSTGCQICIEIEDERKLRTLYDLRVAAEVDGANLGDEYKGYIFRISGGNDKQGFPMKQGVITNGRVRLLLKEGSSCYRQRKSGERKRKSVRGCIVGPDLSVLNLVQVKKGDAEVPGLTDTAVPRRLGPKRASKIRALFNLDKEDDVRPHVIKRTFEKNGKEVKKSPKIQRLITPIMLQRKRARKAEKKTAIEKAKREAAEYSALKTRRIQEQKEARRSAISKRRSSRKSSKNDGD
jgi:small subunit ribosomal protein S6e